MHKLLNNYRLLGLISMLTLASWWAHNVSLFSSQNIMVSKGTPKFFLSEVTAKRFNSEGYEKSTLTVDSIINSSSEESKLVRPRLIFHESAASKFTVTADAGITQDNEKINLMGTVTLQVSSEPTSPDTSVATDFATVNISSNILRTKHNATITRNSLVGFSDGFIYDAHKGLLNLLAKVTLTYDD